MSARGVGLALKRSQDGARRLRMVGADHAGEREKDDFYITPLELVRALLAVERFDGLVWEPACGDGAIAEPFKAAGHAVVASDLVDRGYGEARVDFLLGYRWPSDNIVTNPPFKLADLFWRHAVDQPGVRKVAFCLATKDDSGGMLPWMWLVWDRAAPRNATALDWLPDTRAAT